MCKLYEIIFHSDISCPELILLSCIKMMIINNDDDDNNINNNHHHHHHHNNDYNNQNNKNNVYMYMKISTFSPHRTLILLNEPKPTAYVVHSV